MSIINTYVSDVINKVSKEFECELNKVIMKDIQKSFETIGLSRSYTALEESSCGICLYVDKVGKRWFKVSGEIDNSTIEAEATYSVNSWFSAKEEGKKTWILTGIGSRKYRKEIVEYLENYCADNGEHIK